MTPIMPGLQHASDVKDPCVAGTVVGQGWRNKSSDEGNDAELHCGVIRDVL